MTNGLSNLFDECLAKDLDTSVAEKKSTDNMTCILVQFVPEPKIEQEENEADAEA